MTAKPINLSRARKARDRDAKRAQGDANAARFGRTKGERQRDEAEAAKAHRDLDGHRQE